MEIDVSLGTEGTEVTTDHGTIRRWVEEHGGRPAVDPEAAETMPALRLAFPDDGENGGDGAEIDGSLEPIDWSRFFREFDEWDLALTYVEGEARYEFVDRKTTLRG